MTEAGSHLDPPYSTRDIADAITIARNDLCSQRDGYEQVMGRVYGATVKARKEGGSHWTQRGRGHVVRYDLDHTVGILDALRDTVGGRMGKGARLNGITVEVVDRAEEILFERAKAQES